MRDKTKHLVYAALLTALAIIIPIQFGFLKVYIPPFSATLAAHVPMFIGILISPMVAVVVGIGSTLGFLLAGMPMPVVFRAATHILVGFIGAKFIEKNISYGKMSFITAIIHGGAEALVVIPFIVTGVGGAIHHLVDSGLAYGIVNVMAKGRKKTIYTIFKSEEEKVENKEPIR